MGKRFTWLLAILVLVAFGLLMACTVKYAPNNDALLVSPSQGLAVMQSFSVDLQNGHVAQIYNDNGPPTLGIPTQVVLDPEGEHAYLILQENPAVPGGSINGIETFNILSDGKLANIGHVTLPTPPKALVMDSTGKFLFVAVGGSVYVYSIGPNAALTQVGTPTPLVVQPGGQAPVASALAVTPTVYPAQFAYCSGGTPPSTENLYVTDSVNYAVLNYRVLSTGSLRLTPFNSVASGTPTGTVPSGVAVDPCNRFLYVSNGSPNNNVSAYTICYAASLAKSCPNADFSLQPIVGSPYPAGDNPGPLLVDPYGKWLYVLDTGSNQISGYGISSANGTLTAFTGAPIATNLEPVSMAIRKDDSWLFVSNLNSANISEYAVNPATGTLSPQPPITSFNYPSGVAVK
ncbi:MAG: beta-propeller fold lactonase family protein [Candidatus Sulfotelmatobacter sp.]